MVIIPGFATVTPDLGVTVFLRAHALLISTVINRHDPSLLGVKLMPISSPFVTNFTVSAAGSYAL